MIISKSHYHCCSLSCTVIMPFFASLFLSLCSLHKTNFRTSWTFWTDFGIKHFCLKTTVSFRLYLCKSLHLLIIAFKIFASTRLDSSKVPLSQCTLVWQTCTSSQAHSKKWQRCWISKSDICSFSSWHKAVSVFRNITAYLYSGDPSIAHSRPVHLKSKDSL